DMVIWGKRRVLKNDLSAFVGRLADLLFRLAQQRPETSGLKHRELVEAVVEVVVSLPVYRTYIESKHTVVDDHDRRYIQRALDDAAARGEASPAAIEFLGQVLLLSLEADLPEGARSECVSFIERFQQLTGPAAAKGVEDTALYAYVPLVSLNEVGGEPKLPESPVAHFHRESQHRAEKWPRCMLAVTTHDTKRTADVRSRLDVLSEIPKEW